jgi:hypothetical protein
MSESFNLKRFAAKGGYKHARAFPSKASKYTAFLESWVDLLEADSHPTVAMYKMALTIQRAATLQNTLTPKLTNGPLGVHRSTKYRLLSRLAKLGMIQVMDTGRGRGRAAVVRIIERDGGG